MPDETVEELRAQRRELERKIAAAEGREPRPLTLAEIRKMTPEEARAEWERIKPTLGAAPDDKITPSGARSKIVDGYDASEPREIRERRQASRGARRGLEGGGDE